MIKNHNGETFAVGCVFKEHEHFWMDGMLDITAYYYDVESDTIEEVQVGYIGIDGSNLCGCEWTIDLSRENAIKMIDGVLKRYSESAWKSYCDNFRTSIHKDDTVRVYRGRKVPKGTEGTVFWVGKRYNQFTREDEEIAGIRNNPNDRNEKPIWVKTEYLQKLNEDVFTEEQEQEYKKRYIEINYSYVVDIANQ